MNEGAIIVVHVDWYCSLFAVTVIVGAGGVLFYTTLLSCFPACSFYLQDLIVKVGPEFLFLE